MLAISLLTLPNTCAAAAGGGLRGTTRGRICGGQNGLKTAQFRRCGGRGGFRRTLAPPAVVAGGGVAGVALHPLRRCGFVAAETAHSRQCTSIAHLHRPAASATAGGYSAAAAGLGRARISGRLTPAPEALRKTA